jgi:hypothetical protein
VSDQVDVLLERARAWRAVAPVSRWFEVVARPSATGTIWTVGAWQIVDPHGAVRAVVHHDCELTVALTRTLAGVEAGRFVEGAVLGQPPIGGSSRRR